MWDFFQAVAINTTVWVHHINPNEIHGEKDKWELHKIASYCFEQILKATTHKTAAVQPFTFDLTNHPSKTRKGHTAGVARTNS